MKKYFLILLMITGFLQAQTYQNPTFGTITTKTTPTVTSVNFLTTVEASGQQAKINPVLLPINIATQTALDLKANDNNVVHLSGIETITGEKTIKNKLYFRNSANDLFLAIPELSTSFSAENTVLGVNSGSNIVPIQFNSPTYGIITGGTANTFLGKYAGFTLNAGNENTLIGHNAGYNLFLPVGNDPMFDSSLNTFIGSTAGYNTTTGYANSFLGQKAGVNVTTGSHNVVIGKSAGGDGTHLNGILNGNVIIGSGAAKESPFSQYNVIVGVDAGYDSNGQANVFLGNNAGVGTNINNTFIAGSSSYPINNVYFGKGYQNSSPTNYTINGTRGLGSEITGGNLTIAGGTGTGLALGGDVIVQTSVPITAGTQAHFLSEAFRVKATTGRVGIKTTSPTEQLEVVGNIKGTSFIRSGGLSTEFLKADGSVSTIVNPVSGTGTANLLTKWATSSTQTNSIVQDDGTTVGIGTGTLSAGQKFQVFGNQSMTGSLTINNDGAVISGYNSAGSTQSGFLTFNSGAGVSLASSNTAPVKFFVNGTEISRLTGGNFLIGSTSNTGEKFQVTGTAKITGLTTLSVSPIVSSETANTIASFDGTKNLKSLPLATYPSLTELSYGKGVTSAIQTQIDSKAPLASPALTGTPTAPTPTAGTNTTQLATTAFVQDAVTSSSADIQDIVDATTKTGLIDSGNSYIELFEGTADNRRFEVTTADGGSAVSTLKANNTQAVLLNESSTEAGGILVAAGIVTISQTNVGSGTTSIGFNPAVTSTSVNYPANSVSGTYLVQMQPKEYLVSALPTPTGSDSRFAIVTDALSPTYLGVLTGGGTVTCPAFHDGTDWVAH